MSVENQEHLDHNDMLTGIVSDLSDAESQILYAGIMDIVEGDETEDPLYIEVQKHQKILNAARKELLDYMSPENKGSFSIPTFNKMKSHLVTIESNFKKAHEVYRNAMIEEAEQTYNLAWEARKEEPSADTRQLTILAEVYIDLITLEMKEQELQIKNANARFGVLRDQMVIDHKLGNKKFVALRKKYLDKSEDRVKMLDGKIDKTHTNVMKTLSQFEEWSEMSPEEVLALKNKENKYVMKNKSSQNNSGGGKLSWKERRKLKKQMKARSRKCGISKANYAGFLRNGL